jgi:hypothetical protein
MAAFWLQSRSLFSSSFSLILCKDAFLRGQGSIDLARQTLPLPLSAHVSEGPALSTAAGDVAAGAFYLGSFVRGQSAIAFFRCS